jgi:hypothetical protein
MKKALIIITISLICSACYEKNSHHYQFEWAEADFEAIEKQLMPIVQENNPYPKEINSEKETLNQEIRSLSQQISDIEQIARIKCLPKEDQNKLPSRAQGISASLNYRNSNTLCIQNIKNDPLINDLTEKKKSLLNIQKKQRDHDSQVRSHTKELVKSLISQFSKDKFELVIYTGSRQIIYNKNGLSLNITEAIIEELNKQNSTILLNYKI